MEIVLVDVGEAITERDIREVEEELDVVFPDDYKAFLLKNNGGLPKDDIAVEFVETDPSTNEKYQQGCDIQFFSELREVPEFYENLIGEELIPEKFISIACDSFGNEILLCADESEDYGKVYFGNHEMYHPETGQYVLSIIANSFSELLDKFEPLE